MVLYINLLHENFQITTIICIIIFIVFDAQAYISPESLPALFVLLFLFGSVPLLLMIAEFRVYSFSSLRNSCIM